MKKIIYGIYKKIIYETIAVVRNVINKYKIKCFGRNFLKKKKKRQEKCIRK